MVPIMTKRLNALNIYYASAVTTVGYKQRSIESGIDLRQLALTKPIKEVAHSNPNESLKQHSPQHRDEMCLIHQRLLDHVPSKTSHTLPSSAFETPPAK
jgi:hypothetical protein